VRLIHHKDDFASFRVVRDDIDHPCSIFGLYALIFDVHSAIRRSTLNVGVGRSMFKREGGRGSR
jgi:hypothetical protein